jgi:hypothetical protein
MATKKTTGAADAAQDTGTAVEQTVPGAEVQTAADEQVEPAAETTAVQGEQITPTAEEQPKESTVESPEAAALRAEAKRIMQGNNAKKVWRCTKKGYWFTREESAKNHAGKHNSTLEVYELED